MDADNLMVQVVNGDGEVVWAYGVERGQRGGITSRSYASDGSLAKISAALDTAQHQAQAELVCFGDSD